MDGFGRSHGVRRVVFACLLVALLLILGLPAQTAYALSDDRTSGADPADVTNPSGRTLGIYITSLRDFDVADDSFGVDYWLWSVHPPDQDPLGDVEFVNAEQVDTRLGQTARRGEGSWSRQKVRAIVLHDWSLSNFPFDRQTLRIDLRVADSGGLSYTPDRAQSGHGRDIAPDGWRVTSFDIEERDVGYATTFGDPEASGGSNEDFYRITLQVERDNVTGFFKLIAGVYAAISLGCISFLMAPNQATVFSGRITLLAAALFAVVVNLQVSDVQLGSLEEVALVHKIHILAMAYVFIAAVMAIVSRRGYESGQAKRAKRWDLIGLCAFSISFVVLNIILIVAAAVAG